MEVVIDVYSAARDQERQIRTHGKVGGMQHSHHVGPMLVNN